MDVFFDVLAPWLALYRSTTLFTKTNASVFAHSTVMADHAGTQSQVLLLLHEPRGHDLTGFRTERRVHLDPVVVEDAMLVWGCLLGVRLQLVRPAGLFVIRCFRPHRVEDDLVLVGAGSSADRLLLLIVVEHQLLIVSLEGATASTPDSGKNAATSEFTATVYALSEREAKIIVYTEGEGAQNICELLYGSLIQGKLVWLGPSVVH